MLLLTIATFAQDQTTGSRYFIRKHKPNQDTVFLLIGEERHILKKGWVLTETKGKSIIQRVLEDTISIVVKKDSAIALLNNWRVSDVKHTSEAPEKLIINPYTFKSPNENLNAKGYLKIPENGYITLVKDYFKWSAITIPFAYRPALNDTIGSKITTDLKIGTSLSYNYNWEFFKNRRIEAKKSLYGISLGIGFGFSKVTLNKGSTSLLPVPYKEEEDGLAFFLNPGLGLNLKGFQVVGFYGWDIGLTENVDDWNYNKKGYFGLGLGVDLATLGKL